jgi:hypothetical protein
MTATLIGSDVSEAQGAIKNIKRHPSVSSIRQIPLKYPHVEYRLKIGLMLKNFFIIYEPFLQFREIRQTIGRC